jgi:hypothetical protein
MLGTDEMMVLVRFVVGSRRLPGQGWVTHHRACWPFVFVTALWHAYRGCCSGRNSSKATRAGIDVPCGRNFPDVAQSVQQIDCLIPLPPCNIRAAGRCGALHQQIGGSAGKRDIGRSCQIASNSGSDSLLVDAEFMWHQ